MTRGFGFFVSDREGERLASSGAEFLVKASADPAEYGIRWES